MIIKRLARKVANISRQKQLSEDYWI